MPWNKLSTFNEADVGGALRTILIQMNRMREESERRFLEQDRKIQALGDRVEEMEAGR